MYGIEANTIPQTSQLHIFVCGTLDSMQQSSVPMVRHSGIYPGQTSSHSCFELIYGAKMKVTSPTWYSMRNALSHVSGLNLGVPEKGLSKLVEVPTWRQFDMD